MSLFDDQPTVLEQISAAIGFNATVKLATCYGGKSIKLPARPTEAHRIARLIGLAKLTALCDEFGSTDALHVPHVSKPTLRRVQSIIDLHQTGRDARWIAETLYISPRRVAQVLRMAKAERLIASPDNQQAKLNLNENMNGGAPGGAAGDGTSDPPKRASRRRR